MILSTNKWIYFFAGVSIQSDESIIYTMKTQLKYIYIYLNTGAQRLLGRFTTYLTHTTTALWLFASTWHFVPPNVTIFLPQIFLQRLKQYI